MTKFPDNERLVLTWIRDSAGLEGWQLDSFHPSRGGKPGYWGEARAWGHKVSFYRDIPPPTKEELEEVDMEYLKTRWRKWLGNKTAYNKPYWTTLLDSKWTHWCQLVCQNHKIDYSVDWTRESVKHLYRICIDVATMEELMRLDDIYASEKID